MPTATVPLGRYDLDQHLADLASPARGPVVLVSESPSPGERQVRLIAGAIVAAAVAASPRWPRTAALTGPRVQRPAA